MKYLVHITRSVLLSALALTAITATAQTQNVTILDPGLDAAIRATLHITNRPLTTVDLLNLTDLDAENRNITNTQGLELARNLDTLDLENNKLTNFALPGTLTNLTFLDLDNNLLRQISLPNGLSNLDTLILSGNQLTNLTLPTGLTALSDLDIEENQLSLLTLPQDVTNLIFLFVAGNPFSTLVVSEPIATGNLADEVDSLQALGKFVSIFPLTVQMVSPDFTVPGAFEFTITGPPGVYTVFASHDLTNWSQLEVVTNELGFARVVDEGSKVVGQKFFRSRGPSN